MTTTTVLKLAIEKFPSAKEHFINGFEVTRKNCFGVSFLFEDKVFGNQQLRDVTFCSKTAKVVSDKIVSERYVQTSSTIKSYKHMKIMTTFENIELNNEVVFADIFKQNKKKNISL